MKTSDWAKEQREGRVVRMPSEVVVLLQAWLSVRLRLALVTHLLVITS